MNELANLAAGWEEDGKWAAVGLAARLCVRFIKIYIFFFHLASLLYGEFHLPVSVWLYSLAWQILLKKSRLDSFFKSPQVRMSAKTGQYKNTRCTVVTAKYLFNFVQLFCFIHFDFLFLIELLLETFLENAFVWLFYILKCLIT